MEKRNHCSRDGGERESSIGETQSCDLSLAIGLRRKTLRICVVGKAEGKQPQTSQMEGEMCISECFRLWAAIVLSCAYASFFQTAIHHCPLQFALWTMMLISSCPTFTFPNHHGLHSKVHLSSGLQMSPLLFAWSYFSVAKKKLNHRDGLSMADGIKKENQESFFQQLQVACGEGEANEFVLVENENRNQQCRSLLFRRVNSVVCRGRHTERRSKLSVNKNDSNTNFPERRNNGRGKGVAGGAGARG